MVKRTTLVGFVIALVVPVMALSLVQAQQADARKATKGPTLTAMDYIEIQKLQAQYLHGVEGGADNGVFFANAFTDDGAVVVGNGGPRGRAKLIEAGTGQAKRRAENHVRRLHFTTDMFIEPSPEGAKGSSHVLITEFEPGKPAVVVGGGLYQDIYVKTPQGWRIKTRHYYPADVIPEGW